MNQPNLSDIKWRTEGQWHYAEIGPVCYRLSDKASTEDRADIETCLKQRAAIFLDSPDDDVYLFSDGSTHIGKDIKREILAAIA